MRQIVLFSVLSLVTPALAADAPVSQPATQPAEEKLDASHTDALKASVDKTVAVKGTVSRTGWSPRGTVLFINFEGVDRDGFTAIVRKEDKDAIAAFGEDAADLVGKSVEITGKIILYKGRNDIEKPEIEVKQAEQIKVVQAATQPSEPPAQ